ncbi:hypothetical protein [Sulfuracidifex tepidarius]|uniref:hypothetical protein n=1 Tax=Sulfuracidifex tepidarius TaxID=1294262 RepID=UPI0006D2384F|nr:hypothetical protein [Sulfuracidifex tepidarius]
MREGDFQSRYGFNAVMPLTVMMSVRKLSIPLWFNMATQTQTQIKVSIFQSRYGFNGIRGAKAYSYLTFNPVMGSTNISTDKDTV